MHGSGKDYKKDQEGWTKTQFNVLLLPAKAILACLPVRRHPLCWVR